MEEQRYTNIILEEVNHRWTAMQENLKPYGQFLDQLQDYKDRVARLEHDIVVLKSVASEQEKEIKGLKKRVYNNDSA